MQFRTRTEPSTVSLAGSWAVSLAMPLAMSLTMSLTMMAKPGFAQRPAQAAAVVKAMERIAFMAGHWEGEGKLMTGPGESATAKVTEEVGFKLGRSILMMEGTGTATLSDRTKRNVHEAMGIISYDVKEKAFKLRTYRAGGETLDPKIELSGTKIVWSFEKPRAGTIRFTLTVKDDTWTEVGEMSRDAGKTWFQFFEMKLKRVPSKQNP